MRISVTELDQLIWFKRIEDMTLNDLIARLRREAPPNRAMEMGTAFHSILENPPSDEISTVEQDGFVFSIECDAEIVLPQVQEIRADKTYEIDGTLVTLTGGCDGVTGNVVTDHKLTANPDPSKFFDSYQWRAYLDLYDADVFEYMLYHAKDKGDVVEIVDVHPFKLYRYPGMREDLVAGIREFVEFAREHLPERLEAA